MVTMGLKMLWILSLFVLSFTLQSQAQGQFPNETISTITYLQLRAGRLLQNTYYGRVVIKINNEDVEGAICGTWTRQEAIVACRMLGYGDGNIVAYDPIYGSGNRNFLMSNLRCSGQEQSLSDCPRDSTVNCQYDSPDVLVTCSNPGNNKVETFTSGVATQANRVTVPTVQPRFLTISEHTNCSTQGNIRLLGVIGRPGMGYVQLNVNGNWQYICDDRWSENDAKVVCRELCYTSPSNACARPGVENEYRPLINENPLNFAWNTVHCTGDENNLNSCAKSTTVPTGQCGPRELAGVQCVVPPEPVKTMTANLQCNDLNGDIVVQFNQQEFPNFNQNSVKVVNPGARADCAPVSRLAPDTGDYQMRISPQDCGTLKTDNGSAICYSNKVQYDNEVYVRNVLLDYKKKTFSVECCMPTDKDVSIKFIPKTQEYNQSYSKTFDYVPEISFYVNERCDEKITANPYAVEVGDWVYIGVSVKAENMSIFRDNDLKLVVESCTANPIKGVPGDLNVAENVTLINNKCPAEVPSLTTYPISNTTEGFRFRAFKFFGYSSVYVTCHLRVCLTTDQKPECDRSCVANTAGRKRRDLADGVKGLDTVVSQILQIADPKQPPVSTHSQEDRTTGSINPRFIKH